MNGKMRFQVPVWFGQLVLLAGFAIGLPMMNAQAPARFLGTISAISGNTITVKTDADGVHQVQVPATASIKRIAPGQRDLSTAEAMLFSDLAVGDRALVKLDPSAPTGTEVAIQIVAVKQADVALKQQKEREDWQRRGVGGLVKKVDTTSGVIVVSSGAGDNTKTVAVHIASSTMLKRYAPASVRFGDAQPAPIDAIHVGDQLRARGTKNADGTQIAAEEVISGSFRNISGAIASLDVGASTLVVKDLATKKQVTIHITAEAQMRRLPDRMAQMLAARLKGDGAPGGMAKPPFNAESASYSGSTGHGGGMGGGPMTGVPANAGGRWGNSSGADGSPAAGGPGMDPQQLLSRAPVIQLGDLKKGDAVMLVSTDGTSEVTAITLMAGVEPLLEAPAASRDLLSSWSMNSGSAEAAAQ